MMKDALDENSGKYIQLHPADNVLVALQDLSKGSSVPLGDALIFLQDDISAKHKFFTTPMRQGDGVTMYGVLVGRVQHDLPAGSVMTVHNTVHAVEEYRYRGSFFTWQPPEIGRFIDRTFKGYHRSDGKVGTANYWIFLPTVFCENRNLDVIKDAFHQSLGYATTDRYKAYAAALVSAFKAGESLDGVDLSPVHAQSDRLFDNIDGIKFLNHEGGCGGTRQDAAMLGKLLASYADHPNVCGVTVLSLGCQHLQVADFMTELWNRNPDFKKPLLVFEQQKSLSEAHLIRDAIRQTFEQLIIANNQQRQDAHLSKLSIGVKCGGSDGFSGISANPAVGYAADLLVALGGKVLLAEFPELCSAEQDLVDRAVSESVARKFMHLMKTYDELAQKLGSGFYMNPSPGNIKDGLITDAIKSAGAAKKGGTSPVVDVLDYTEQAVKPGLHLVCTPGNDVEATTGKTSSGATLILFTTGLGTPTGNPICPVIKIATNSELAHRMSDIIDIDTGPIIKGHKTVAQMGEEILEYCIRAASGEVTPKAVLLGQDDFIPWKRGVSL